MLQARRSSPKKTSEIKAWVREILRLDAEEPVLVSELACTEPGCPPLETIIAVLPSDDGKKWQFRVRAPLQSIEFAFLAAELLALTGGGCGPHESTKEK